MNGRIRRVLFYFVHGERVTNKDSCSSFFSISSSRKNPWMIMLINEQTGIFIFLSHSARNRGNSNITISNINGEWLNELCHCHNHMKAPHYCIFKVILAYECVLTSWTCKWVCSFWCLSLNLWDDTPGETVAQHIMCPELFISHENIFSGTTIIPSVKEQ